MAEITSPAEIAGIQEANTAVLPSGMPLNDLLLRAGQFKYAMDEAKRQRDQKQVEENTKMFDFDTVGVWSRDIDAINNNIQKGIKQFGSVDFLKRYNNGDLNALNEYQQWKNGLNTDIQTSKVGQKHYLEGIQKAGTDVKYQNDATKNAFDTFANTPLSDKYPELQIETPYNEHDYVKAITPKTEIRENGTVTTSQTPIQDILANIEGSKQSPKIAKTFINHWNPLIMDAHSYPSGSMGNPVMEYYDENDLKKDKFTIKSKPLSDFTVDEIPYTREIFDPAYSKSVTYDEPKSLSNGNGGGGADPSKITWVVDGIVDIKKGTGQTTVAGKSTKGNDLNLAKMFKGQTLSAIDDNGNVTHKTIENIGSKDGKMFVTFTEDINEKTGNAPYHWIDNAWNEIVIPVIQDKYGDDALEELKQYAIKQGVADVMGIPTLNSPTNTGTQQQGVKPKEDLRKKYNY